MIKGSRSQSSNSSVQSNTASTSSPVQTPASSSSNNLETISSSDPVDYSKTLSSNAENNASSSVASGQDNVNIKISGGEPGDNNDYFNLSVRKDTVLTAGKIIVDKVVPNLGAVAAGSALGNAMVKASAGQPLTTRMVLGGGGIFVGTVSSKVAMGVANKVTKNDALYDFIQSSPHSDPKIDRVPSPGVGPINSPLEKGDLFHSPLEDLLGYSLILNFLILILVILFLLIIFNRYIYNKNSKVFTKLLNFLFRVQTTGSSKDKSYEEGENQRSNTSSRHKLEVLQKKIDNFTSKINKLGEIFNFSIFVIFTLLLIFNIILNIYINSELLVNIDKYVSVYNNIYGNQRNNIILLVSCCNLQHLQFKDVQQNSLLLQRVLQHPFSFGASTCSNNSRPYITNPQFAISNHPEVSNMNHGCNTVICCKHPISKF